MLALGPIRLVTDFLKTQFGGNPRQDSLLVRDGGGVSGIFWVCKMLSSIPLCALFGA